MLLESLGNMVQRWLRIPPGTQVRKAGTPSTSSSVGDTDISGNEYVQSIVSITVDDICIGSSPL